MCNRARPEDCHSVHSLSTIRNSSRDRTRNVIESVPIVNTLKIIVDTSTGSWETGFGARLEIIIV